MVYPKLVEGFATLLLDTLPSHVYSFLYEMAYDMIALSPSTMSNHTILGIAAIGIAAIGIFSNGIGFQMNKPLITGISEKKADFHTPVFSSGYYLPMHITNQLQIGPDRGIAILASTSTIEEDGELIIDPGTTLVANEYASIRVKGSLRAIGTLQKPIRFISNEMREENRTWAGILFTEQSRGVIDYAIFHHASPSISCEKNTNVIIRATSFSRGNLDVFGPCLYTPNI